MHNESAVVGTSYVAWRYHTDPTFREEWKKRSTEWRKQKLSNDPSYRAKLNEQSRVSRNERYKTDPEFRARRQALSRQYITKKREKMKMSNVGAMKPCEGTVVSQAEYALSELGTSTT